MSYMDFQRENRQHWRNVVRECLGKEGDMFSATSWEENARVEAILRQICVFNLSYGYSPATGGYEFISSGPMPVSRIRQAALAEASWNPRTLSLASDQGQHEHWMDVERIEFIPHPDDEADSVFRVVLSPRTPTVEEGWSVREDGYREEGDDDDCPTVWLHGAFLFSAKCGRVNDYDPEPEEWLTLSHQELCEQVVRITDEE